MRLAETTYDNSETGCCARLDTDKWDGRVLEWKDKPFLKDHINQAFHIPLNFGKVMSRDHEAIEAAGAYPEEPIWLTEERSPWRSDVYVALDRELPDQDVARLSGTFLARVFEGPYREMKRWVSEMEQYVGEKGFEAKKMLFYYPVCPDCAKKFGKNEVVILARVE
jgi:hypothetical protein